MVADGQWIVSTYTSFASGGVGTGVVQVWNSQTGKLAYTLATDPAYEEGKVSRSADGKYIAGQKVDGELIKAHVSVWSVQTHQVVFQQTVSTDQGLTTFTWQPGTDNLAVVLNISRNNRAQPDPDTPFLKLWNVTSGCLLQSAVGPFSETGELSWSSDGQEIVYSFLDESGTAGIIVLNVDSGKQVYI